jgi:rhomboid protease GluP
LLADNGQLIAGRALNPNQILILLVATSAIAAIVRALRVSPSLLVGWIGKNVFVLAVLGVCFFLAHRIAGYLAAALWAVLVLAPTLLQRLVVRASIQQKHGRARMIARVVAVLHPFDGFLEQGELYRGLDAAQRGEVDAAAEIFDRLRQKKSVLSKVAAMHFFRVTERWQEFADWTLQMAREGDLAKNPTILITYLRSLGEIGEVERLVRTHQRFRSAMERGLPATVHITVLAFAGRRAAVDRMLDTVLAELPETVKSLWRATTDYAAGEPERAREQLSRLLDDPDASTKNQAKFRLDHPPPVANEVLSPEARTFLDQLERELEQEERYKPAHGGLLRRARATWVVIAASVAVFAIEILAGGSENGATLLLLGAVEGSLVLQGEVWRLVAATFLHYGFLHLFLNMIGLMLFGPFVERSIGSARFLFVYLLAGSGAMGAVVVKAALLDEPVLLVGASGGVMAMLGATAFLLLRGWRREHARPAKAQLNQIAIVLLLQTGFDLSIEQVSFLAHFCGMLLGFGLCALVSSSRK